MQAAALQRRSNRCPELATLAASLRIRLPGYPSQRTDRCVGGARSFLIRDVTASLWGEQHYKDRLSGLVLGALGHRWDAAFKPSVNDSRGFRGVPVGVPLWNRRQAGEDVRHQGPKYRRDQCCRLWGLRRPLEALGCGRTLWCFSGDKLCHRHLFSWSII